MKISVVTTLYYSAPYIAEFCARSEAVLRELTDDYELVIVNDGSPDNALQIALELHQANPAITVVDLSRNFGHHKAIMTGLAYATGDLVFFIDCDLEEEPELLRQFYAAFTANDVDVVYGVQQTREGSWFRRVSGHLFYVFSNALSPVKIPQNLTTTRLMTRRYVNALLEFREKNFIIGGLWSLVGFKQLALEIPKSFKGRTSYTLWRKFSQVFYGVTSISNLPLIYIFWLGMFLLVSSVVVSLILLTNYLVSGYQVPGWASVVLSVWFFGGLNISALGIVSLYLAIIFTEVKERPYTIVRQVYRRDQENVIALEQSHQAEPVSRPNFR